VSVVSPSAEPREPSALEVTFWIRPESAEDDEHLLIPRTSERIPGVFNTTTNDVDSSRWEMLFQTISGRRGLMLVNVRDEGDESNSQGTQILRLVSYERHKTQVVCRDLVLPDFIDLFRIHGLFLDDHLGVVSMIDPSGVLYTIPYA